MSLVYLVPDLEGPLRQGEVLENVWEFRAERSATEIVREEEQVTFTPISHPIAVILTNECDLEQDFYARYPEKASEERRARQKGKEEGYMLSYVTLCDAHTEDGIRPRIAGSDIWKRLSRNQDERYHRLAEGAVGSEDQSLTSLYLDFKRQFFVSTSSLYGGIKDGGVRRRATIPPVYIHDLIHRFYSFHSRIGTPS